VGFGHSALVGDFDPDAIDRNLDVVAVEEVVDMFDNYYNVPF